jgi:hypothetical protein
MRRHGLDLCGLTRFMLLRIGAVRGACEHGNETILAVKWGGDNFCIITSNISLPRRTELCLLKYLFSRYRTPWLLVREPRDLRLSTKLLPTFVDAGCCVVNITDPYGRIFDFLDHSRYFFFQ